MAILVGLLVAASFGSGDFLGGLASGGALTVLAFAQAAALVGAVAVALVAGGPITGSVVWLGAGAGLLNVLALGCLYQGLAVGQIGEVAPVAAVVRGDPGGVGARRRRAPADPGPGGARWPWWPAA